MRHADRETGDRRDFSLCLPPKRSPTTRTHINPTPLEVGLRRCYDSPLKKGTRALIPCPQQRTLPDEIGKYATWDAALVGKLV